MNGWPPEQRDLVFPNTVGRITRYGAFFDLVWKPVAAAKLPYWKPDAMWRSYATWTLEAGASIEETEGSYGYLERERHEGRVNPDMVLGGVHSPPPASTPSDADGASEGQLRDISREVCMVEGKGFEPSTSALRTPRSPN